MIFGILALSLKNKTLGIIAIISGVSFSVLWLASGLVGDSYAMLGSLMIILFTCVPDLIMGIISVSRVKSQSKSQSFDEIVSKNGSSSLTEKINEINSLKEKGLLTEEEYSEAKKNILKN